MKQTEFDKFFNKNVDTWHDSGNNLVNSCKESWNVAIKNILRKIKYRNKVFEGNWQHEDIEFLIEDLEGMIEKY